MSVELRWYRERMTMEKMREFKIAGTPYDYGDYFPSRLQYRAWTNPLEAGLQPPLWTDWQDVPTVKEERK